MHQEARLLCVGRTFSARVPKSSAEVRRVFVHHIVEIEHVWQQEQQGDQRDGEEREEMNGGVEEDKNNTRHEITHACAMRVECELVPMQCAIM